MQHTIIVYYDQIVYAIGHVNYFVVNERSAQGNRIKSIGINKMQQFLS